MKTLKWGLVDVSSVLWTCLLAGKDKEFGREVTLDEVGKDGQPKKRFVNGWQWGYENTVNHLITVMEELKLTPRNLILVPEGRDAKAERQFFLPTYKAGRDKVPQQYEQFNKAKDAVIQAFLDLGAQVCWQDGGVEADDVLAYLAGHLMGERWVISGDKDLAAVVNPDKGIHHYRMGSVNQNPFGEFPHRLIPTWIALVGDSVDKIPGAHLFGETAGMKLRSVFGDEGLELMEQLIKDKQLLRLQEDVGELKELQRIIDSAEMVYTSYEVARLRTEKINTVRRPLSWRVGMVKPKAQIQDNRLRKWGGVNKLVSKESYVDALAHFKQHVKFSPYVTLDIEASTPEQSDAWIEAMNKDEGKAPIDTFGARLTGLSITYGWSMQYTVYLTADHVQEAGITNLTMAQVRDFVNEIPRQKYTIVHNASYELPICYMEWGEDWAEDQDWNGFLRNVIDSALLSSYADENRSKGLKSLSQELLGYTQTTYEEVTTKKLSKADWLEKRGGRGKVKMTWTEPSIPDVVMQKPIVVQLTNDDGLAYEHHDVEQVSTRHPDAVDIDMVQVQFKMNELKATEVFDYGCDDTICTAAISNHFIAIMQIENTWGVYLEVEQCPAYVTALAFVQGVPFSLEEMREQEKADDAKYEAAAPVLRDYLLSVGFEGTVCPVFDEINPANVKEGFLILTGIELKSMMRRNDKLALLVEEKAGEAEFAEVAGRLQLYARAIRDNDLGAFNDILNTYFSGEPPLEEILKSPKKMANLLYDHMRLPIRIVGDLTDKMKENIALNEAMRRFKKRRAGSKEVIVTDDDMKLLRGRAKTDDTAIDFAIAFDSTRLGPDVVGALRAIQEMKKVITRRSLFYSIYWTALHWKDGKLHPSLNQAAAVTRRYSASNVNVQQLPKKGEGVAFRGNFKPHKKNAVVVSIDYVGQELRLSAEKSQDRNLLACYVGDHLKDPHSITAAGAMPTKWGKEKVDALYAGYGSDLERSTESDYTLFVRLRNLDKSVPIKKDADDLRKDAKNVNFAAQNGAMGPKVAETIVIPYEDADIFLKAREAMFPGVGVAAEKAAEFAKAKGYAQTFMGARRHLAQAIQVDPERASRQAWNFEIQGSAGEMSKLGMSRMWKARIFFKYDAQFYFPVHDEMVASVVGEQAVDFIREMHACMTGPYANMQVPILGSISLGPDFKNQIECGDYFVKENIEAAVNEVFTPKCLEAA